MVAAAVFILSTLVVIWAVLVVLSAIGWLLTRPWVWGLILIAGIVIVIVGVTYGA